MPLRSVEAASRDDAIAAAREQFGPHARVVGVRRVRSGGVLGFFATERYVAEVAETGADTSLPAVIRDDGPPTDFSSPLASAAPARARAAAPARNGAAAWAAAAASRPTDEIPDEVRAAAAAARAARTTARAAAPAPAEGARPATRSASPPAARPASRPASRPADDERVSELVGLLSAQQAEPAAAPRTSFPRASFPRTAGRAGEHPVDDGIAAPSDQRAASAAPSPFTAALARMVAGDQDVRQAVHEALVQRTETQQQAAPDAEPRPGRSEPTRSADTAVPPSPARQEEETVGDQVIAPPSTTDQRIEVPTWAATPEASVPTTSQREEAIADLLRGALAQGHSDEALAGILRKVLAGASPHAALADQAGPMTAAPTLPVPALDLPAVDGPVLDLPTTPAAVVEDIPMDETMADQTVTAPPIAHEAEPVTTPEPLTRTVEIDPVAEASPVVAPAPADSMWGVPVSASSLWDAVAPITCAPTEDLANGPLVAQQPVGTSLFGEPAEPATDPAAEAPSTDAAAAPPVVESPEAETPEAETPVVETSVAETPEAETPVAEALTVESAAEVPAVEPVAEEALPHDAVESGPELSVEEPEAPALAPLLARTASDPAPMTSLDATTVMPPLSLLPPLPSSRGRGRPPVPPAAPRVGASRPSRPPVPDAPVADVPEPSAEPDVPTATSPTVRSQPAGAGLATVTRLPVASRTAEPHSSELPDGTDQVGTRGQLDSAEPVSLDIPTPPADSPAPVEAARGDVSGELVRLGLPAELLGSTFQADADQLGTYAALTRSLALRLPAAPELPRGAGETVFVVGPGADALRAARSLAASLHLDPDCVQWATRGDLAGLAPRSSRISSVDTAIDRQRDSLDAGTVTVVAVDAPLRGDARWMTQMADVWAPVAVWAVVEATRKPEDLQHWLGGLPRVDALIVQDAELSADPAAVLRRVDVPVAVVDGMRATPHRWASLLCERLESTTA